MTALGFRIKSGRAIAVVLAGSASSPNAVACRTVDLCDPNDADTRQPYHHGFYTHEEDAAEIARRVTVVERCAADSVAALVASASDTGALRRDACRAVLVVGSVIDPATVANPHIRAHASEGRLFRVAVQDALRAQGIDSDVVVDKTLTATASKRLGRSDGEIRMTIAALGRTLGGAWRADEKAAATAAWLALPQD
jgi:hypothetical protein